MELTYDKNVLLGAFNKYFTTGRKLKPKVIEQSSQSFDSISQCKISVHVIRGENIPIRTKLIGKHIKEKQIDQDKSVFGQKAGTSGKRPVSLLDRFTRELDQD